MGDIFFLLSPIYVTFFWAVVLNSLPRSNNASRRFLGKFMMVAFVVYLSHLVYFTEQFRLYLYIGPIYILASLLVYPLYHIYVRLLTVDLAFSFKRHWKYLAVPFSVFVFYLISVAFLSTEERLDFLETPVKGFVLQGGHLWHISLAYNLFRVVFVLQVVYFLAKSFLLISKSKERLEEFYSNPKDNNLGWIHYFNITLAVTSIASVALAIVGRERFSLDEISLVFPSIIFSVMLFSIGFLGLRANTKAIPPDEKPEVPGKLDIGISGLTEEKVTQKIKMLLEEQKIYSNPNLKIWDVSGMLGTNRSYTSHIINKHYRKNFRHLINSYRVKAVVDMVHRNPQVKNQDLVEESGFGSLSSLYRSFADEKGVSFQQFKEKLVANKQ